MVGFKWNLNINLIGYYNVLYDLIGSAEGNFDVVVHNQIFKKAYLELRDFILKELEAQYNEGINVCLDRVPLSENDHNHD